MDCQSYTKYRPNETIGQLEFQLNKLKNLVYPKGNVCVSCQSTTDLSNIPSNSIDYCFIDPPFGANIMYSELNFVAESWLRIVTKNKDEAIINKAQRKSVAEYHEALSIISEYVETEVPIPQKPSKEKKEKNAYER